ncbi:hypothetical protein ABT297_04065 [Dactylosporangium sp. NPDC000555]|uniref:hypothetical protein n=1 Tax=Dactylosporangium sp. NPDC000555 TaxID=3154260 RepID=UPI00331E1B98
MTTYDLGDRVPLRHKVYDAAGQYADATVALTLYAPDGTISTPAITRTSTGVYDAAPLADQVDSWQYRWDVSGAVPEDVVWGAYDVGNPAPPLYVGLDLFRSTVDRPDTDTGRDFYMTMCLDAASRGADAYCGGRQFWRDRIASTRVFRARGRVDASDSDGELIIVDDIASTVDMVVEVGDGTTWIQVADYDTEPENALAKRRPINALRRRGGRWSSYRFVRVTARWGWPAVPAAVIQATQIQASRLYKRRTSPEGVTGTAEWGVVRLAKIDPDVQALLADLQLPSIG